MPTDVQLAELHAAVSHEDEAFGHAAVAVVVGNADRLVELLAVDPSLATQASKSEHGATLLHYVSSNAIEDALQRHPASVYKRLQVLDATNKAAERETLISNVENIILALVAAGADADQLASAYGGGSGATPINWLVSSAHPHAAGVTARLTRVFCECGARPDGVSEDSSPLLTAVGFGVTVAVAPLLKAGCKVDNVILAAIVGDRDKLKSLLANRDQHDPAALSRCQQEWLPVPTDFSTASQWALVLGAMCGQVDCVRELLESGADIDALPKISHMTGGPLHTACLAGQVDVIDLLIERGANPTVRDPRYSGMPVDWARQAGDVAAMMKVGNYRAQFVRDSLRSEAVDEFLAAVRRGDVAAARKIVEAGKLTIEQLNAPWFDFDAPAVVAVKHSLDSLDCLIAAGADINQKSLWWAGGYGVLHDVDATTAQPLTDRGAKLDVWSAASLGNYDALVAIVKEDPSGVNARGPDGQTALHSAKSVEIAKYLIDQGADVNRRCFDHNATPIQYAIKDRMEVASELVNRGSEVDLLAACALGESDLVRDLLAGNPGAIAICVDRNWFPSLAADHIYSWVLGWYQTAHQVAAAFGHGELVTELMAKSPPPVKLLNACLLGDESLAVEVAASASAFGPVPVSVAAHLSHAARNNEVKQVALMLEHGFPVDATGQHGATALHWAAFHGNVSMAETILKHSPPREIRDPDFNCTPLQWARQGCVAGWHRDSGKFPEVATVLLAAGCEGGTNWKPTGNAAFDAVFS